MLMALPDIRIEALDGGIGVSNATSDVVVSVVGLASSGDEGVVQEFVDPDEARSEYGRGALTDGICDALLNGASSVLGVRVGASTPGSVALGEKTPGPPLVVQMVPGEANAGIGGTVTISGAPSANVHVEMEIVTSGAVGTATFKYRLNGGAWSEPISASVLNILGDSGVFAIFAGGTVGDIFVATDTFDGGIIVDSTGVIGYGVGSNPLMSGDLEIEIVTTGKLNSAIFIARLGATTLEARVVQASVALVEFGITVTFAEGEPADQSFVAGDVTVLELTASSSQLDDIVDALGLLRNRSPKVHIVYVAWPTDEVQWAVFEAKAEEARLEGTYMFFLTDSKHPDDFDDVDLWVADLEADAAATKGVRFGVIATRAVFADYFAPSTTVVRSIAGCLLGRLAKVKSHVSPCKVADGPLVGPIRLYPHDSGNNSTVMDGDILELDTAGFITGREWDGWGKRVFVTNFRMMAPAGSDYTWGENRRVMDEACRRVKAAAQRYVHAEGDLLGIADYEKALNVPIREMVAERKIQTGSRVTIPPGQAVASTSTVTAKLGLRPVGTMRYLEIDIGFLPEELEE
jgi:hypothetical protein